MNARKMISLVFSLMLVSAASWGSSAGFAPVPMKDGSPLRLQVSVVDGNDWLFDMNKMEGAVTAVFGLGTGFDVGVGIHGGLHNREFGLWSGADQWKQYGVGADMMVRFLGDVTEMFFMGVQVSAGYDFAISDYMKDKDFKQASHIAANVGVAFGVNVADVAHLYLYPDFHFGRKAAAEKKNVWGSDVGGSLALGCLFNFGDMGLVLEAKTGLNNVSDFSFESGKAFTELSAGFVMEM